MEPENTSKTSLAPDDQVGIRAFVEAFLEDPLAHLPPSRILKFETGQVIYSDDRPSMGMHVVIEGRVTVCRRGDSGRPVMVDIYQMGDFFGESALSHCPDLQEQAVALEDTKVMTWTTAEIEGIVVRRPELAVALLQILVRRLTHYRSRLHSFATDGIPPRLVRALIHFSERFGHANKDGSMQMIPLTHELISQYVGTSREVVTHFMNRFRREGYLNYSRREGIVVQRHALMEWLSQQRQVATPSRAQGAAIAC